MSSSSRDESALLEYALHFDDIEQYCLSRPFGAKSLEVSDQYAPHLSAMRATIDHQNMTSAAADPGTPLVATDGGGTVLAAARYVQSDAPTIRVEMIRIQQASILAAQPSTRRPLSLATGT